MSKANHSILHNLARDGSISRRDFIRAAIASGLTAGVATTIWSSSAAAAVPRRGGILLQGVHGGSSTDSLDPISYQSLVPSVVGYQFGERLFGTDPITGRVVPELGESIETIDAAKTWVVKLRNGVTFHNGRDMAARDVVYSLNRHRGKDSKSGAAGQMKGISDIKATGGNEITISLKAGNVNLPFFLTDYHLLIQPEGSTDDGIGTGGYIVKEAQPGVRYYTSRNPDYWNDDGGFFDAVETLVINDDTARALALMTGKAQLISSVDPKTLRLIERNRNIVVENTSARGHYVFVMHVTTDPFVNYDLRMALKLAVDREQLLKQVLHGYGQVGNDFPINSSYALFPKGIEQRRYDPDKAKYHYKRSGYSGPVLLHTSDAAFAGAEDTAVLYQQQAARAGIKVEVRREPADGYWSDVWNKKPFCVSYWGGRPTQDQMYSVAYKSDAPWNDTRWFRPKFDELLIAARTELDEAKRAEMYRQMALLVRDDGGLILPMFNDFIDARATKLAGFVRDPTGPLPLSNGHAHMRCWFQG
jgi:peptide/nickel transport system substrate-binding protein